MLWSDLREIKATLEIDPDNTAEDLKLSFFLEQVSAWFGEWLDRPDLSLKYRSLVPYSGQGTQKLLLRHRPVFPALNTANQIAVYVNEDGNFGSSSGAFVGPAAQALVYGTDYCLDIDQDDGSSRSGILIRLRQVWPRPTVRQAGYLSPYLGQDYGSVRVSSWAGYTVDSLPAQLRMACDAAVAAYRFCMPLGMPTMGNSYEGYSVSFSLPPGAKSYLFSVVKPFLSTSRNWRF